MVRIWLDPFRCGFGWIHCILVGADLVGSIAFWLVRIWLDPLYFGWCGSGWIHCILVRIWFNPLHFGAFYTECFWSNPLHLIQNLSYPLYLDTNLDLVDNLMYCTIMVPKKSCGSYQVHPSGQNSKNLIYIFIKIIL